MIRRTKIRIISISNTISLKISFPSFLFCPLFFLSFSLEMGWGAQRKDFFICFLLLQRGSCVEHGEGLLEQSVFLIAFFRRIVLLFFAGASLQYSGLTDEITIVRGQGRQGAYAEDKKYLCPSVDIDMPSEYLLPRRDEYTRVYTTVYPRVHNCIHACTQVRSKYLLCRACLYVCFLGIMPRIFSDRLRLPGI